MTGWQELAEDVGDAGERMQAALVGVKRSRSRDLVRMASDGQPQR